MNAIAWAGLGSRRGAGESLVSWLRAGPLGELAIDALAIPVGAAAGALYCPACYVDEAGTRRWYTRSDWLAGSVICTRHAVPLVRCETPPARLRGWRWPPRLRAEFRALGAWTRSCGAGEAERAVVEVVRTRTDPRVAYSCAWAAAQWHLRAAGWPVPVAPRYPAQRGTGLTYQFDRLALMAIAHRACVALAKGQTPTWPPLPVRARALTCLDAHLRRARPAWVSQLSICFRNAT